jgi:hypothetical protein
MSRFRDKRPERSPLYAAETATALGTDEQGQDKDENAKRDAIVDEESQGVGAEEAKE